MVKGKNNRFQTKWAILTTVLIKGPTNRKSATLTPTTEYKLEIHIVFKQNYINSY